jgi:hypothetical protein
LLKVFQTPIDIIPNIFAPITAIRERARVVFISAVPERINGMKAEPSLPFSIKPKPPKGSIPSQLFTRTNIKIVNASGNTF